MNAKENRKYRRWRTAVILKIDIIWRYLSEKSSDFDEVLHAAADFKLDERHVIKNEKKLHWTDSEFDQRYFLLRHENHYDVTGQCALELEFD